jgi:regulator of protease activity HflC (stomatin/prohibitin superfamily)
MTRPIHPAAALPITYPRVETGEVGIVERNCKYNRLALPGCLLMCWPFESLKSRVSLRIMQLDIRAETKTKDNVFVMVYISIQYQVSATQGIFGGTSSA